MCAKALILSCIDKVHVGLNNNLIIPMKNSNFQNRKKQVMKITFLYCGVYFMITFKEKIV